MNGLAAEHHAVLKVVVVGDDADIRADHHTIIDGDATSRHARKRVVHEHTFSNLHLTGKVNLNGRHQIARLIEIATKQFFLQWANLIRLWSRGVNLETDVGAVSHVLDGLCIFGCCHIDISP